MLPAPTRLAALLLNLVGWPLFGLLAVARAGTFRRAWQLDLVDTFAPYLGLGWPLLGGLAVGLRSPSLGLLAGLGGSLALSWLRFAVGRGRREQAGDRPRLRVLTANVLGTNANPAGLLALVDQEQPDVVLLQEVRGPYGEHLVAALESHLPHYELAPHERFGGAAILSRYALEDLETFKLVGRGHYCQRAWISLAGRRVDLFNVHADTPFEIYPRRRRGWLRWGIRRRANTAREAEVDRLLELLAPLDGAVVVGGDFNTGAGSRPHRQLLGSLRDAFLEAGRGLGHTFPQRISIHGLVLPFPILRIDYLFCRGGISPLCARTLHHAGSDHRVVLTDFALE